MLWALCVASQSGSAGLYAMLSLACRGKLYISTGYGWTDDWLDYGQKGTALKCLLIEIFLQNISFIFCPFPSLLVLSCSDCTSSPWQTTATYEECFLWILLCVFLPIFICNLYTIWSLSHDFRILKERSKKLPFLVPHNVTIHLEPTEPNDSPRTYGCEDAEEEQTLGSDSFREPR